MPKAGNKTVSFSVKSEIADASRNLATAKPRGWLSLQVEKLLAKLTTKTK